jgi:AcrR family transcriptional regulator
MIVLMGRPKLHDAATATALVDEAERIVETAGLDALTVRRVASGVGATTRAVYSVFGSKEALVTALGIRAFELLRDDIDALPRSDDPGTDLVEAGVRVFRRFAIDHPALFEVGFRAGVTESRAGGGFHPEAYQALDGLRRRVERLDAAGRLGTHSAQEATTAFHALCEGLAALELRSSFMLDEGEERWRQALTALVQGFAAT